MPKKVNMLGLVFGKLTVIAETDQRSNDGKVKWLCSCQCGKDKIVCGKELRNGDTRSCGCLTATTKVRTVTPKRGRATKPDKAPRSPKQVTEPRMAIVFHGLSKTSEYHIWKAIKQRCCNPKNHAYKYYGARGIDLCERWLNSFENFIVDMGNKPEGPYSIDRRNNDLGYSPDNCFWATKMQQGKNKRNNRWLTYKGETRHLQGWADYFMIPVSTLHSALKVKSFEYLYEKYAF